MSISTATRWPGFGLSPRTPYRSAIAEQHEVPSRLSTGIRMAGATAWAGRAVCADAVCTQILGAR